MQALVQQAAQFEGSEALRFLQLLGKDPEATWFRSIKPKKGANKLRKGRDLHGFNPGALAADTADGQNLYLVVGNASQASGLAIRDDDITECPAVFAEWDEGTEAEQLQTIQASGLPEPSVILRTGGKSLHAYWLLKESISRKQWEQITRLLIAHTGSDPSCSNASRVMRLPGSVYHDKATGQPTGCATIVSAPGHRYDLAELLAALPNPEPEPEPASAAAPHPSAASRDLPPRTLEEIRTAAEFIPLRVVGGNTYETCRRALCGCAAALAEIGLPEEQALDLLSNKWPDRATAQQALQSSTTREAASFWAIARDGGFNTRTSLRVLPGGSPPSTPTPTASQQDRQPISMAEVSGRLRQALAEGATEAQIVELVAELSADADHHPISIQRLAEAIRAEQRQAAEVRAEAVTLAAEADRQELGQILTAAFLLPPTIAAAIETRTRYLPCEGPSAVLPFLATVAGLVKLGTEVEGCAVAGYYVPINLFTCLVGDSGAKKSPVGRLVVDAPTRALRDEMARCNQRQHEEWEQACRDQKRGEQRPPAPRPKQLKVSDYTGEALAAQLQTQEAAGLGLLINRDELSGLFGSLNQYRGGKGGDEQQLLELFDGGGLSSLRIVGDRHYSRSQVSIWGSTQPDVLRQLVADGDASGLWARFLFVPLPKRAVPLPLTTTPAEVAEVEAAAQTLADTCNAVYRLPRQTYRLAPAAAERFGNYELSRQRAALGASIGAQSALYGKSAGKVLRVAGVLHLLQIAAGEIDSRALIAADTIDRAAALVDHLDAWALGLHAEVAAGGVGGLMRTVHKAAEAAGAPIRWSELLQRLSKQQRKETDSAAAGEAMRALAAAGYGEVETGKRGALSYRATRALP